MKIYLTIIVTCLSFLSVGQKRLYICGGIFPVGQNTLFLVDADNCTSSFIGYTAVPFHDIAMSPVDNELYGVYQNDIYRIDKTTASVTLVTSTSLTLEGLTFSSDGTMYSTDDGYSICKIDITDGSYEVIGVYFEYAGHDLTFYNCSLIHNRPHPDLSLIIGDPDNFWNATETFYYAAGNSTGKLFQGLATLGCPPRIYGATYSGELWRFTEDLSLIELICSDTLLPPGYVIGGAAAVYDETNCEFRQDGVITMPNVFTPNSDNINDVFLPKETCGIESFDLQVLNRWGEVVFNSKDSNQGWDGKHKGINVLDGTYSWILSYTTGSGAFESSHGIVQVIR